MGHGRALMHLRGRGRPGANAGGGSGDSAYKPFMKGLRLFSPAHTSHRRRDTLVNRDAGAEGSHSSLIMGAAQTQPQAPVVRGRKGPAAGTGNRVAQLLGTCGWPWKCPCAAPALSSCAVKGPFRAGCSELHKKWESLRSLNEISVPFSFL